MAQACSLDARPLNGHALRSLLGAALCAALIALLCAALGSSPTAPPVSAIGATDAATLALPAAAVDSGTQLDNDVAVRPAAHGIGVRHSFRKPRRTNRRLRVPGRGRAYSGSARAGTTGIGITQSTLKNKRMSKRALMRRLMTVRGGLQA